MENILEKSIHATYLNMIKSGRKRYEGRLRSKIVEWQLYAGKKIRFYDVEDKNSSVLCEVTELRLYKDFAEAYDDLGEYLIRVRSKIEVVRLYNYLFHDDDEIIDDGRTSNKILREGVVAIGINVIG